MKRVTLLLQVRSDAGRCIKNVVALIVASYARLDRPILIAERKD